MKLSKSVVLELLNLEVKRVYRASLISITILLISSLFSYLFLNEYKGIVSLLVGLTMVINIQMTKGKAKKNVASIYLLNKDVCEKLSFFRVVEKDKKVNCMLGGVRIDRGISK